MKQRSSGGRQLGPLVRMATLRPWLWPALLGAAWTFRPQGWQRRPPFLPVPSRQYLAWRLETAYGEPDATPPLRDVVDFVRWSHSMRRRMRRGNRPEGWVRGAPLALKTIAIAAILLSAAWVNLNAGEIEAVRDAAARAGYPGLFLAAAASGFNLVWPVPVALFFPFFLDAGFAPVPALAVISAGMTCGDLLGYLIGRATRSATRDIAHGRIARFQARAEALGRRHRLLPLGLLFLYAAFVPLPNELVVVPMAFLRYSLAPVMAAVLCGNAIFNTLVALGATGAFGM